jgi:O-antigen ligase
MAISGRQRHADLLFGLVSGSVGLALALLPWPKVVTLAGGLGLLGILALIFAQPICGLGLALIVGPLQPLERVTLGLPLDSGQAVLAITLAAYGAQWLAQRTGQASRPSIGDLLRQHKAIALGLLTFLTIAALSFFVARDARDWAAEWIKWLQIGIVALLVARESEPRRRAVVLAAALLAAIGQAAVGLFQANWRGVGPPEFRVLGAEGYRAYGSFEQPNPFGGFMGLTWPLAAALAGWAWGQVWSALRGARKRAASFVLIAIATTSAAALSLAALSASGSRGALIGAAGAATALVLAAFRPVLRWAGLGLAIGLALLATGWIAIPASLEAQLAWFSAPGATFGIDVRNAHVTPITFSTIERLAHWQAAIRMIEASPWLGQGFGNYAAAYPDFRLLPWENALGHAHNYYLNIFAELGLIGLLSYVAFWAAAIATTWRVARQAGLRTWPSALAVGILGAWAHLSVHHLFDKLYVANMHLYVGAYLGVVMAGAQHLRTVGTPAQHDIPSQQATT